MIHNKSGQTVLPEYVVMFFLVIAAISVVTVYVQRSFQARVHSAKEFMLDKAISGCDEDCQAAAGAAKRKSTIYISKIPFTVYSANKQFDAEYEPYYGKTQSNVTREQAENENLLGVGIGTTSIAQKQTAQRTEVRSVSEQLPPKAQ